MTLPYLTAELPGTGGVLRTTLDDFAVDEVPAYPPAGDGHHVFARIEKRDLTTAEAIRRLASAVDVRPADVGAAGMKDRRAVTRQWLSLPPPATPEAVLAAGVDGVRVLEVARHPHKLKTGHLRGNRFTLVLRGLACDAAEAAARATAILRVLSAPPGAPNWYGAQRFGRDGDNAAVGRALVTGGPGARRAPRGRQRRLFVSALQSALFNEYLRRRLSDGLIARVLAGDVLRKVETGGTFTCADPDADQARLDAGELVVTGPMYGHKLRSPPANTPSAAREDELLAGEGLSREDFKRAGKLAEGTRRPLTVRIDGVSVSVAGDDAIQLELTLPAGSYATAIMREVVKGPEDFPE